MLTPNLNDNFKIEPILKNKIFNSIIKYSMSHIIPFMHLPLAFESKDLEIWRFSAPFYGFFYDRLRKNFSLWVNISLKKNYGFMAPLFYSFKSFTNYKRFWYINSNSWSYFSYLFKKSLYIKESINDDLTSCIYSHSFHCSLDSQMSFFESSEIAINMAMVYSRRNNWLIEESNLELDHWVSTYDWWCEMDKYNIDFFRNKRRNFFNLVDSSYLTFSLFTRGYYHNSVLSPKLYIESKYISSVFHSLTYVSFFISHRSNNILSFLNRFYLIHTKFFSEALDSFNMMQSFNFNLKYFLYKLSLKNILHCNYPIYKIYLAFYQSFNFIDNFKVINQFISKEKNINNNRILYLKKQKLNWYWKFLRSKYKKYKFIRQGRLIKNQLNKYIVGSRNFLKRYFHKGRIIFKNYRKYFSSYYRKYSSYNYKNYKKNIFLRNYYMKNDRIKITKSWIFALRWDLNFLLARYGRERFNVATSRSTSFLRRFSASRDKNWFYVFLYEKNIYNLSNIFLKYVRQLIYFTAKCKFNFHLDASLFNYKRWHFEDFYRLFLSYFTLFKGDSKLQRLRKYKTIYNIINSYRLRIWSMYRYNRNRSILFKNYKKIIRELLDKPISSEINKLILSESSLSKSLFFESISKLILSNKIYRNILYHYYKYNRLQFLKNSKNTLEKISTQFNVNKFFRSNVNKKYKLTLFKNGSKIWYYKKLCKKLPANNHKDMQIWYNYKRAFTIISLGMMSYLTKLDLIINNYLISSIYNDFYAKKMKKYLNKWDKLSNSKKVKFRKLGSKKLHLKKSQFQKLEFKKSESKNLKFKKSESKKSESKNLKFKKSESKKSESKKLEFKKLQSEKLKSRKLDLKKLDLKKLDLKKLDLKKLDYNISDNNKSNSNNRSNDYDINNIKGHSQKCNE